MSQGVTVLRPGLLTTVQDEGRWGWQSRGVSVSGPMDPFALRMANALAGNDRAAAALEVTLAGPELRFEDPRTVAVAGALFELFLDDRRISGRHAFDVGPGACLRFGRRASGARAYLAISGGITVPPVLGSRATHVPSAIGGWKGRALSAGDRLPLGEPRPRPAAHRHPLIIEPRTPASHAIRVLPGPDEGFFESGALETLQRGPYRIEPASNRMGYRLTGPPVVPKAAHGYVSDVTAIGTVQVPPSGQPILLMADRQTTGGYPRLVTVIAADVGVAGQGSPGEDVRFELCTPAAAHEALIAIERRLMAIEAVP